MTRSLRPLHVATARAVAGLAVVLGAGPSCDAIAPVVRAGPPVNACPAHPCSAYMQSGAAPTCGSDGVCAVDGSPSDALLVIQLAVDSIFAPGRTYLTTLDRAPAETGTCALQNCSSPTCQLVHWVEDMNSYLVNPSAAVDIGQSLGNSGVTALPVQATYRPLMGASMADAIDLGLPLSPVVAESITTSIPEGPFGGPEIQFQAYMQPGCYERTLQPYPAFSPAFPPEIKPWTQATGMNPIADFDLTTEETGLPMGRTTTIPTFDIARAEGLDGWTAYLRSIDTKRVYSNVAPLSGSLASGVVLATNHLTSTVLDALDGLELVLAPPAGDPLPTEVLAPVGTPPSQELPAQESYPSLPLPMTVSGTVATSAGVPVPATIIFTATDIFDRTGTPFPPNFEFVTQTSTLTDSHTGASTYSVALPQGDYTIAVQPTDGSSAITSSTHAVGGQTGAGSTIDLTVGPLVSVSGRVAVADGRALADAVVEVIPTACAAAGAGAGATPDASSAQSIAISGSSDACIPRGRQTLAAADGSFALEVDPGSYLLRVRPVEGSHLPWTRQSLVIGPGSGGIVLDKIAVPAPIRVRMTLTDTVNNAIVNAIVRVFTDPGTGEAPVELGRAITDSAGNYEIDLAPPAQ